MMNRMTKNYAEAAARAAESARVIFDAYFSEQGGLKDRSCIYRIVKIH